MEKIFGDLNTKEVKKVEPTISKLTGKKKVNPILTKSSNIKKKSESHIKKTNNVKKKLWAPY